MGDEMDVVGADEQGVNGGAVQVLHSAEVDGKRSAAARSLGGGGVEGLVEGVDVAQIDFPAAISVSSPSLQRAMSKVSDVGIR
jgi:hypothetical protein